MTRSRRTSTIAALLLAASIAAPAAAQGTFDAAGKWIADPPPAAAAATDATDAPAAPKQADPLDNQVCTALGPGFVAVAGGTTCVRIGGYVKMGTSVGHGME